MTVIGAKIRIAEEKSMVEVCRESAKMLDFQRIGMSWGLLAPVLAGLMTRRVEIEPRIRISGIIYSVACRKTDYEGKRQISVNLEVKQADN